MTYDVKEASVWPVNEQGEVVVQRGVGTASPTGFIPNNLSPVDPATNKVVFRLPDDVAVTAYNALNQEVGIRTPGGVTVPYVTSNAQIEDTYRQVVSQIGLKTMPTVVETIPTAQLTGTKYYIDPIAGSDSNNGTAPATPWANLTKLVALSPAAGSVIHIAADGVFDYAETLAAYKLRTKFPSNSTDGFRGSSTQPIIIKPYVVRPASTQTKPIVRYYARIVSGDWTNEQGTTVSGTVLGANVWSIPWVVAGFTTDTDVGVAFGSANTLGVAARQQVTGVAYGNTPGQLAVFGDYAVSSTKIYVWSVGNPNTYYGSVSVFGIPVFASSWQGLHWTSITGLRFELCKTANLTHGSTTQNGVQGFEIANCEYDKAMVGYFNSAGTNGAASEMQVSIHDNVMSNMPGSSIRFGITNISSVANTLSWEVYRNQIRGGNLSSALGGALLYVQSVGGTKHIAWGNYGYDCRNGTGGNNIDGAFLYSDDFCNKAIFFGNIAERCGVAFQHNLTVGAVNLANLTIDCVTYAQVTGATGAGTFSGQTYVLAHNTWLWTGRVATASIPIGPGLGVISARPIIQEFNDNYALSSFANFACVNNLAVSLSTETATRPLLTYNASKITTTLIAGNAALGLSPIVTYDTGTSLDTSRTAGFVSVTANADSIATWLPDAAGGNAKPAKDSVLTGRGALLAIQYQDILGKNYATRPTPGCYEPQG